MNANAGPSGFQVQGGTLLDANGQAFILRGVNLAHAWYPERTPGDLACIAATGANAVRVVLGNGGRWAPTSATSVRDTLGLLKQLKMVAILEVHDVTGYPEESRAADPSTAVAYWIGIQELLQGQEGFVLVNIANEPVGNRNADGSAAIPRARWSELHREAITALRAAGIRNTLVVDAANYGQDWEGIMLADAPGVFQADPLGNTIFSVHMYEAYDTREKVRSYLAGFRGQHHLPLIVGEFGMTRPDHVIACDAILELAETYGTGWLAWSWYGNDDAHRIHDLTTDGRHLAPWGDKVVHGPFGIGQTSVRASIFT